MTADERRTMNLPPTPVEPPLAAWLIRDLVAAYPETMAVLGPLGIDLCCGGARALGGALALHGLDAGAIVPRVAERVAGKAREG